MEGRAEALEIVGAAIWVARETARFNMFTEAGDAWTAAMCVAAVWGQASVVDWMNGLGRKWSDVYAESYLSAPPERLRRGGPMEALARGMPHGADYNAAAARCEEAGMRPSGGAAATREFRERHRLNWASALVTFAEESCYEAGLSARDVERLEAARGVTEAYLLKAIGAQLVARRQLVTEIPHRGARGPGSGRSEISPKGLSAPLRAPEAKGGALEAPPLKLKAAGRSDMEAATETAFADRITRILRASGEPMRAIDIVRKFAEEGVESSKEAINKALYRGPFDKIAGAGAPRWTARAAKPELPTAGHFVFQIDGIGAYSLREDMPRENIKILLEVALSLVPEGAEAVVRVDGSPGGKAVAELAEGRAAVKPLAV